MLFCRAQLSIFFFGALRRIVLNLIYTLYMLFCRAQFQGNMHWATLIYELCPLSISTNLIIEFVTGCKIVTEDDIGQVKASIRSWEFGPEVGCIDLHSICDVSTVIKHRCKWQKKNPLDQIDIEFALMTIVNTKIHPHVVLPNVVCFAPDFSHVLFIGLACWYFRNADSVLFGRKLSFEEAHRIFTQIVIGLDFIQQHNIVHRDLVLKNVLVDNTDVQNVAIADFGCACSVFEPQDGTAEIGHYSCRPPEPYLSMKYDIYALHDIGMSLFYTNTICITEKNLLEEFEKRKDEMLTRNFTSNVDILMFLSRAPPPPIHDIIQQCYEKDPCKRPTCAEILNCLENNRNF